MDELVCRVLRLIENNWDSNGNINSIFQCNSFSFIVFSTFLKSLVKNLIGNYYKHKNFGNPR